MSVTTFTTVKAAMEEAEYRARTEQEDMAVFLSGDKVGVAPARLVKKSSIIERVAPLADRKVPKDAPITPALDVAQLAHHLNNAQRDREICQARKNRATSALEMAKNREASIRLQLEEAYKAL